MTSQDDPITTGQAADYCHVTRATVVNWIKQGKLKAYTTPGGHFRIPVPEFLDFLKSYGMPIDPDLQPASSVEIPSPM